MKQIEQWITVQQLKEARHMSESTQYRRRKDGTLKFEGVSRRIMYTPQQISDFFSKDGE